MSKKVLLGLLVGIIWCVATIFIVHIVNNDSENSASDTESNIENSVSTEPAEQESSEDYKEVIVTSYVTNIFPTEGLSADYYFDEKSQSVKRDNLYTIEFQDDSGYRYFKSDVEPDMAYAYEEGDEVKILVEYHIDTSTNKIEYANVKDVDVDEETMKK